VPGSFHSILHPQTHLSENLDGGFNLTRPRNVPFRFDFTTLLL